MFNLFNNKKDSDYKGYVVNNGTDNIRKLKELTQDLTQSIKNGNGDIPYTMYEVEGGDNPVCKSYNLHNNGKVAVAKTFLSKGSKFPKHDHVMVEVIVVYEGEIVITFDSEEKTVGVGGSVYILPNVIHKVEAIEDTWLIAITVPADEGFPTE